MNPADRLAICDLVHRYAAGVDDRRFDDVVELFAENATLALPDPPRSLLPVITHRGRAEIRQAVAAVEAVARTQHGIVGEVYSSQDSAAQGRISCVAHHWTETGDQKSDIAWHLRYDDHYVRSDSGWRFQIRAATIDAIETRPVRRFRPQGN